MNDKMTGRLPRLFFLLALIAAAFLFLRESSLAGVYRSSDFSGGGRETEYDYDTQDTSRLREDPYSRSKRSNRHVSLHGSSKSSRGSNRHVSLN